MNAATPPPNYAAGGGGGGGSSKVLVIVAALVALVIGAAAGGYFSPGMDLDFIPNPPRDEAVAQGKADVAKAQGTISSQKEEIAEMRKILELDITMSTQDVKDRIAQIADLNAQIETASNENMKMQQELADAKKMLDARNDAIAAAQTQLEKAMKDEAISQARNQGLRAENAQLVNNVGELEEANARRQATLDTLIHNVNLLDVQIQGSSPLAPQRFSHKSRTNKVAALKSKVSSAKWVTPQLLNEYTDLYIAELGIASSREYFFAKIPIHDSLDVQYEKWAECLMNVNWSVYYRTLDGTYVGTYENTSPSGAPKYAFREDLPESLKSDISAQLSAARPDDYDAKYKILMGKEAIHDNETNLQKKFSSLLK